ncbi:choloylglycine hydrolase [Clostridium tarantellae]|uniref:choloylglycine hydrolase n=1 Tax=Clostridium tarantellae TaxID=39493 RepID=A0A6I1MM56_9CLOT|nr:choloylglycine hydrolase [Clostridium tarantellae]MPQ43833.1 linear amide C-N hydrolase [Clostridium tarantellae]
MCTGLLLKTKDGEHLFGRNMDIEFSFNQQVGVIPRSFTYASTVNNEKFITKYAIIGMMTLMAGHPMLADGMNEKGLACAGLNFPGYSYLSDESKEGAHNIPCHDFMLWMLGQFQSVKELKEELKNLNLMNKPFGPNIPEATLHWMVTDKTGECIVIENTKEKLSIFDNTVGVLTNSPTFDWHLTNLRQYMGLSSEQVISTKWDREELSPLGVGVGAVGMPGDETPASRFIRAAFLRHFLMLNEIEHVDIGEFYHILNNVAMTSGAVRTPEKKSDLTQYSSCMSLEKGIYYYNTYKNNQINAINMHNEDLDGNEIKVYPYSEELQINYVN